MSVKIITDSASDVLTPYHPAVSVLPMTITFGDQQYRDKEELSHQRFYELLIESEQLPSTSQIGPAQFEEAFQAQVDAGHSIVAVILSGKLSGTYQSACIAAEEFPQKVFVVDSENAALGEGILVQRAAQLVDQGLEAPEIAQRLEDEKKDIRLIALLDTLEYLQKRKEAGDQVEMVFHDGVFAGYGYITVAAEELWMMAVIPAPTKTPISRLLVKTPKSRCKRLPADLCRPSAIAFMPYKNIPRPPIN